MRKNLRHAVPVTLGVLGLMLYWFVFANRTVVFLYDHDMGLMRLRRILKQKAIAQLNTQTGTA